MLRKSILALTAIAALGATVTLPTTADAKWKKHHHHGFHNHGFGFFGPALIGGALLGGAIYAGNCYERRWIETPYGLRKVRVNVC